MKKKEDTNKGEIESLAPAGRPESLCSDDETQESHPKPPPRSPLQGIFSVVVCCLERREERKRRRRTKNEKKKEGEEQRKSKKENKEREETCTEAALRLACVSR